MSIQRIVRKKILRRNEAEKTRKDRVVCEYIRIRHPNIYLEAENVYNQLKQLYPEKKDLRKSNEFEEISKHGLDIPIKKYYIRKIKPSVPKDGMVLTIPLMSRNDMDEFELKLQCQYESTVVMDQSTLPCQYESTVVMDHNPVVMDQSTLPCQHESTVVMDQSTLPCQHESTVVMDQSTLPCQHESTVVMDQSTLPCQHESTVVMDQPTLPCQQENIELPLTEAMMADLINDLRGDPDICSFFENIDFELDDCPLW